MSDDEKPQTALAKASADRRAMVPIGERGIALQNLDDLMKFAKMACDSIGPKGMTESQAAIAIQAGLERGLGLLGGLQAAVVINNVLSWRGWAAVGFIQNSPVVVPGSFRSWVEGEGDSRTGYCRAQRKGYTEPFLRKYSVKDAKVARLWTKGGPWESRPDNMLEWRAIGDMARFHFGDVMGNLPIAEDVEAGAYGPPESVRELPPEQRPAPPSPVRDPILAELVGGAQGPQPAAAAPQVIVVEATLVPEPAEAQEAAAAGIHALASAVDAKRDERRGPDKPNLTGAMSTDRRGPKAPETQAIIDAQVDEVFPKPEKSVYGPEFDAAKAGLMEGLRKPAPLEKGVCPRCEAKLNAMAGCDVCGFPGADNGERP